MGDADQLANQLRAAGVSAGLCHVGITTADRFENAFDRIVERREAGMFGRMRFTMSNPAASCDPRASMADARSLVVGAFSYRRDPQPKPSSFSGRVAQYAWADWYGVLRNALEAMAEILRRSGREAEVFVDSSHLVDRAAAARASVGYFGKNSNLITEAGGSWVILGSILTDASLPEDPTSPGDCGECARCIPMCPTDAIVAPGVIDARRCIAYLVQAPDDAPRDLRVAIGDRIYGCDECQERCPANLKLEAGRNSGVRDVANVLVDMPYEPWIRADEILSMNDDEILTRYERFYIPRNQARFMRRNALVVLGNSGEEASVRIVAEYLANDDAMLRRHAVWALGRLGSPEALQGLRDHRRAERDASVIEELDLALRCNEAQLANVQPG